MRIREPSLGAAILVLAIPLHGASAEQSPDPCSAWPRIAKLDSTATPPRRIHFQQPSLPKSVSQRVWSGAAVIDETGLVTEVRQLKRGKTDPAVDTAVTDAVKQWRYEPYMSGGKATALCMLVTVTIDVR